MRFERLDLLAFGPFTERILTFATPGVVEVVHGLNEAGKSTALRAITDFLYGIPVRTTDAHLHDMPALRIGAVVSSDGARRALVRRKGRKETLAGEDGEPVPEEEVSRLLGGVTRELFLATFALDHGRLREGGEELVRGGGELGRSLFGASLGRGVHRVLASLSEEADAIFLPAGKKPPLNAALRRHHEAKKAVREASLRPEEFRQLARELEEERAARETVRADLREKSGELASLERLRTVLPLVGRLAVVERELALLSGTVLLPAGAAGEREAAEERIAKARPRIERLAEDVRELESQLEELEVPGPLLLREEEIEEIREDLGAYEKARKDRPDLEADLREAERRATGILEDLGAETEPEAAAARVIGEALEGRIRRLASDRIRLLAEQAQVGRRRRGNAGEIEIADRRLTERPPEDEPADLAGAVRAAAGGEQLAEEIERTAARAGRLEREAERDLAALPLAPDSLDRALALPVPSRETLERVAAEWGEREQELGRCRERGEETGAELERVAEELATVSRGEEVPTEERLRDAREERERSWRLVRRAWLDGEDVAAAARELDPERELPDAHEARIARADEVSDRLRWEADRVARLAALVERRERLETELAGQTETADVLRRAGEEAETEWRELFGEAGIVPLPPHEMLAWRDRLDEIRRKAEEIGDLEEEAAKLEAKRTRLAGDLRRALRERGATAGDGDLATLHREGEAELERISTRRRERRDLEDRRAELEEERLAIEGEADEVEEAVRDWRARFEEEAGELGLPEDRPEEIERHVDALARLRSVLAVAEEFRRRISGMDRDERELEERIRAVAGPCAPDLSDRPAPETARELLARLKEGRERSRRREKLEDRLSSRRETLDELRADAAEAREALDRLVQRAGVEAIEGLPEAERASEEKRKLLGEADDLRRRIGDAAPGRDLEEVRREAEETDPDALPGRIAELGARREEAEAEFEARSGAVGALEERRRRLDGTSRAAAEEARAREELARIRRLARRYVRLRLASHVLEREIERYRAEHQAPLLLRAGELFATLTNGSFERLSAGYDEKETPVLYCIRPAGEHLAPDALSEGTADQLYLALRIAAVEHHAGTATPLPLVADDLFVNFDDRRARAGLEVLGELAGVTQVLLFTHHAHLRDLAKEALGDRCRVHELTDSPS